MRRGPAWESAAFGAVLVVALAAYLQVHALAGLTFPIPWADEGTFLWQAIAVQERGTLFAPELNPDRHVMWMPPAYPILMGLAFDLTGFSLSGARWLSAVFVLGALLCLAGVARRLRHPVPLVALCGAVFLGRHFVLTGNIARMEALLVLAFAGAAAFLVRGRRFRALAVLALSALVHPNGLYPAAAVAAWAGIGALRPSRRVLPSRGDWVWLGCAAAAWLAYLVYVGLHWDAFLHDMAFQLSWKGEGSPLAPAFWSRLLEPPALAIGLLLALALAWGARIGAPSVRLLLLAVPIHLLPIGPHEWYYQALRGLLFLLVCMVLVDLAGRTLDRRFATRPLRRRSLAAACLLGAGLAGGLTGWIESPRGYPFAMRVYGMRIARSPAYVDAGDRRAVRDLLSTRGSADAPATVMFLPWADALLFHDLRDERLRFVQPTFHTVTPDLTVIHLSRHAPADDAFLGRDALEKAVRDLPRIRVRDRTEQWVYNPEPGPTTHGGP